MNYTQKHLQEAARILQALDSAAIEKMAGLLAKIKASEGRIFFLGVGGSAANCSHAVNDFRKLAGIECYAPTDNVSELTARINDDGWEGAFVEWLKVSRLAAKDAVFVLSVGGGNVERNISTNLVAAVRHAKTSGATVVGILGRDGGHTAQVADAAVIVPTVNPDTVTPARRGIPGGDMASAGFSSAAQGERYEMGVRRQMMRPAVFLDRDGVINRAFIRGGIPHPPSSLQELEILPGVPEALSALRTHGYLLVVVTNQPDVARGTSSRELVDSVHGRLRRELDLDAILTCFHDSGDECECRKPKPGLLHRAAEDFGIDLSSSFMVGDRWRDVEAGRRAGCRTFFIDGGYDEKRPGSFDFRVGSLLDASKVILGPMSSR